MSKTQDEIRLKVSGLRSAAASQRSDMMSGNYPANYPKNKLLAHIEKLESEAEKLEEEFGSGNL